MVRVQSKEIRRLLLSSTSYLKLTSTSSWARKMDISGSIWTTVPIYQTTRHLILRKIFIWSASSNSSISKLVGHDLKEQRSSHCRRQDLFSLPLRSDEPWFPPSLLHSNYRSSKCEARRASSSNAEYRCKEIYLYVQLRYKIKFSF
jgi:hypothetical protein